MVAALEKGYQDIAVEWTLWAITLFLISLRIYCRLRLKGTLKTWEDFFAILAFIWWSVTPCLDTNLYRHGFFDGGDMDADELKTLYVDDVVYFTSLYCAKASMLCFYLNIVPKFMRKMRMLLWFTMALCIACFVTGRSLALFYCEPMWTAWTPGPRACHAASHKPVFIFDYASHILTDLFVYTIPMPIIRALGLSRRQKVGAGVLFGLGFMCILFAAGVITASWTPVSLGFAWTLGALEESWAVVIVCAPSFKYLLTSKRDKKPPRRKGSGSTTTGIKEIDHGTGETSQDQAAADGKEEDDVEVAA